MSFTDYVNYDGIYKLHDRINLTTNWSGTDNEANFKNHPKSGYTEHSIIYKYNSYGFRTEEFDFKSNKPSILCLGCSMTEGVGVNIDEAWPSHIQKELTEFNVYNLGVGGGSSDTVARMLCNIRDKLNVCAVFILWPLSVRYEVYNKHGIQQLVPRMDNYVLVSDDDTHYFNLRQKNKFLVNCLATIYRYRVVSESIENIVNQFGYVDKGRDDHPGPMWHKKVAESFIKKYHGPE